MPAAHSAVLEQHRADEQRREGSVASHSTGREATERVLHSDCTKQRQSKHRHDREPGGRPDGFEPERMRGNVVIHPERAFGPEGQPQSGDDQRGSGHHQRSLIRAPAAPQSPQGKHD